MKLPVHTADVGARVHAPTLPAVLLKELRDRHTYPNPAKEAALIHSPYAAVDMPDYIEHVQEHDDGGWLLHRGVSDALLTPVARRQFRFLKYTNSRVQVPVTFPKARLALNAEQLALFRSFQQARLDHKRPFGNYLLLGSTSVGKTILQAAVAAHLGQRTAVMCFTELIAEAWYEDLHKMFGLGKSKIGLIKGGKEIVGDHFTLVSVSTLGRRRAKWPIYNKQFGTIVIDEAHKLSHPTCQEFMHQCPAQYLVGATATTKQGEGINYALKGILGDPIAEQNTYHMDTQTSMRISEAEIIQTNFEYEYDPLDLQWHDLAMAIGADEERNELIVSNVVKDWRDGASAIVVTKTIDHVRVLIEMLKEQGIRETNEISGDTNADKFYTRKLIKMVNSRKVSVIVATVQAIKEGANIRALDTMHIAMPPVNKTALEQLFGRIRRKHEGKSEAKLRYYLDHKVSYLARRVFARNVIPVFRSMKIPGYERMYVTS